MMDSKSCPFCGMQGAAIDTLNCASGKPSKFRAQCQGCLAATRWHDTAGEAESAWSSRAGTAGAGGPPLGTGRITATEMAKELGIRKEAVRQRLFTAKIKPLSPEASYPASALEAIRNAPKPGQHKARGAKA